jgi:RNA polymerase sigma-70 factor (ECF subfamily)
VRRDHDHLREASASPGTPAAGNADTPAAGDTPRTESPQRRADVRALERVAAGDESAFNEVYHRYRADVFGYLCRLSQDRHLADDLLQTVFLKVLQNPERYDPRWPLKTWLLGIARNAFIDWTRKVRREVDPAALMSDRSGRGDGDDAPALNPADPSGPEIDRLVNRERQGLLEQALSRLPWPQREAILLVKVAGLPIREAAEVIDGTEGMVKMRLRRGLVRLMELMGPDA